ncbi:hypothetical protein BU17DRAFT_95257 [Hysterangium stoloniferum]|nr:hypothetical protein BU17DRAFT_95257 [Hysterangium stoloniferum]
MYPRLPNSPTVYPKHLHLRQLSAQRNDLFRGRIRCHLNKRQQPLRNAENPCKWILIDWEDAATPPTKAQPRFNTLDHSPRILEDNHGAEVDIWGVGHLITSSTASDISSEFKALGKLMCEEAHKLTAQIVLKLLRLLP